MANGPGAGHECDAAPDPLKVALLGATVRGDRGALAADVQELATSSGVTDERILGLWVRHLFIEALERGLGGIPGEFPTEDLERLPLEYLANMACQLARVLYTDAPPPSRAS